MLSKFAAQLVDQGLRASTCGRFIFYPDGQPWTGSRQFHRYGRTWPYAVIARALKRELLRRAGD